MALDTSILQALTAAVAAFKQSPSALHAPELAFFRVSAVQCASCVRGKLAWRVWGHCSCVSYPRMNR
jgi:hypothetical protein